MFCWASAFTTTRCAYPTFEEHPNNPLEFKKKKKVTKKRAKQIKKKNNKIQIKKNLKKLKNSKKILVTNMADKGAILF